jgi:hypothetical protein
MRGRFLFVPIVFAGAAACDDERDYGDYRGNEIIFGLRQEQNTTTGQKDLSASYEFLGLTNRGGWEMAVFRDGDGEGICYFERYDHRLGQPRVEGGVATFRGGALPPGGVQLLANQPTPVKIAGAGWATNDLLTFNVSGFAMPPIDTATMLAPAADLTITGMSPAAPKDGAPLALSSTDDIGISWTPVTEKMPSRVMISLETEEPNDPGGDVRCFSSAWVGTAVIPHQSVAFLFSSVNVGIPIKGHLLVATHRQLTIDAEGDWTVYVVATTIQRDLAFTGTR